MAKYFSFMDKIPAFISDDIDFKCSLHFLNLFIGFEFLSMSLMHW